MVCRRMAEGADTVPVLANGIRPDLTPLLRDLRSGLDKRLGGGSPDRGSPSLVECGIWATGWSASRRALVGATNRDEHNHACLFSCHRHSGDPEIARRTELLQHPRRTCPSRWAARLRAIGAQYVALDCLRPILDGVPAAGSPVAPAGQQAARCDHERGCADDQAGPHASLGRDHQQRM